MKFKGLVIASALVTSTLFAQNISVTNNWQLLGATENIDATVFDKSGCVDFVWKYNNGWKLYIANGQSYSYSGDKFTSLSKGEGFWIKGNNSCSFDTNSTHDSNASDFKFTKDWLSGKTLYYVQYDDFGHEEQTGWNVAEMTFKSDGSMVWNEIDTIDSGAFNTTYRVDSNGNLFLFDDQTEGSGEYSFTSKTNDYLKVCEKDDNDCNTYFFFDKQKALDFRDQHNNKKFTSDILDGKTFYSSHDENHGESTGFVKFTFSDNKESGHFMIVNNTTKEVELDTTFSVDYSITEDGKIKVFVKDDNDTYTEYSVLKSVNNDFLAVIHQEDENDDGTIDHQEDEPWYFQKPSNYPVDL